MDLLTLLRLFGRHKIVVAVTSTLTVILVAFTYASAPPVYRASGSIVLFEPPPLPELPEGAPPRGPEFRNPFLQIGDMSVVVDILVRVARTSEVRDGLEQQGLEGTYTIGANIDFYRGPIVDVAAEEATSEAARGSASLIMAELGRQMEKLQAEQGVDSSYQIRTSIVQSPERATTVFSSALRRIISVVVLGGLLIVCSALLAEAFAVARGRRRPLPAKRILDAGSVPESLAPPTSMPRQPLTSVPSPLAPPASVRKHATPVPSPSMLKLPLTSLKAPPQHSEESAAPAVVAPDRSWSQSGETGHDASARSDVEVAFLHSEQHSRGRILADAANPVDDKVNTPAVHPFARAAKTVLDREHERDVEELFRHVRPPG